MSREGENIKSNGHTRRRVLLTVALVALGWYLFACWRIARQQWRDEARNADAIVVFGAAEYAGRPSPTFRARLDHAFSLYQRGFAKYIIVTGGYGPDPTFSEGGVGRDYLIKRGIPEDHLIAETQATNTNAEAERVSNIMSTNGMKSCIVVSDPYHMFRTKATMEHYGITPYASPRPETQSAGSRVLSIMREALSYSLWKLRLT